MIERVAVDTGSRHPKQVQGVQRFSLLVPYDGELAERTKTIVLRRGATILARRDMHGPTPTISLRESFGAGDIAQGTRIIQWDSTDPGGSPLMHTVEYSKDGGKSWMPIAVRIRQNQINVDFDQVAGSDDALVRVRASNGVHTTQATSNNHFQVRRKPPIVTMQSPVPNARIVRTVPLIAIGSATTLEEGPLTDPQAYTWISSRDGVLGHGRWIALNCLSLGEHELILTVSGNQGATSSVSHMVMVREP